MKKIFLIIFIPALVLSSCDILDLKPLDKYSEADVWIDGDLSQAYVNAQYHAILHQYVEAMTDMASDDLWGRANWGNPEMILLGAVTADNVTSLTNRYNIWSHSYGYIRNCNDFLEKMKDSPIKEDHKRSMTGEIKFIRAWVYANLIFRYGGVPLITKVYGMHENYTVSRTSFDDCIEFIVSELDEATQMLGTGTQSESLRGRASGHACMALKSRVLLYAASPLWNSSNDHSKWQKASDAAAALMNPNDAPSGVVPVASFRLENNYNDAFLKSTENTEIIFATYFVSSNNLEFFFRHGRVGSGGLGGSNPTQNLVNMYEMAENGLLPYSDDDFTTVNIASKYNEQKPYEGRDPRFYESILYDGAIWQNRETQMFVSTNPDVMPGGMDSPQGTSMPNNVSVTGYLLRKFIPEELPTIGSSEAQTNPYVHMRYAEILLNYAEAQFALGNEDVARTYINKIRERKSVNMPPVPIDVSGDDLRKKIQNERRIEMAFEGYRYFDVRRWKIAEQTETKQLLGIKITKDANTEIKTYEIFNLPIQRPSTFDPKFYLLPIPRVEIDKIKEAFPNNPGY